MSRRKWDKETARKLWEEGKSDPAIAQAVGVAVETVFQWRKKEGLAATSPPAFVPKPKKGAAEAESPADERTATAPTGGEDSNENEPSGPVELCLELKGGWARLRAPRWEQAAKLWRMLHVCVEALGTGGGV